MNCHVSVAILLVDSKMRATGIKSPLGIKVSGNDLAS